MLDPFRLAGKLFLTVFRISGYTAVCVVQCCIYLAHRKPDKVGDALGDLGRGATDAFADLFRSH